MEVFPVALQQTAAKLLSSMEERGGFRLANASTVSGRHEPKRTGVDFIRIGGFRMAPWFKPLGVTLSYKLARGYAVAKLRKAGFVRERDVDRNSGLVFYVRRAHAHVPVSFRSHATPPQLPLFFIHGVGMGVVPYVRFVLQKLAPLNRTIVAVELPNISHGVQVKRYPTAKQIAMALKRKIDELEPLRQACDVIGHSYGTAVMTYLNRVFPNATNRRVYIDPICFCVGMDCYVAYAYEHFLYSWRALASSDTQLSNILSSYLVQGDLDTQFMGKRCTWVIELWEHGFMMTENAMILLSGNDTNVSAQRTLDYAQRYWPETHVVVVDAWAHGGFLVQPDKEGALDELIAFVSTSSGEDIHIQHKVTA
jgi:pimeloyl-ACP methyl ester carboxylesterase